MCACCSSPGPGRPRRSRSCRPTGWCRFLNITARGSGSRWRSATTAPSSQPSLWPADRVARAHARSISAEMHAGFRDLRMAMWMNLGRDFSGLGRTPGALADIARIEALWADTRARFGAGGPFLFGHEFSAADAMFAPVVARFLGWRPELIGRDRRLLRGGARPSVVTEWYDGAAAEPADWLVEIRGDAGNEPRTSKPNPLSPFCHCEERSDAAISLLHGPPILRLHPDQFPQHGPDTPA